MPKDQIRITLLRHGRSRADDEEVHEGSYDSPLTATGRSQAQTRAEEFFRLGYEFDRIVTSPMSRARETAEIVGSTLKCPVEVDRDWREMDNGPLAGMNRTDASVTFPKPEFRNTYEQVCGTGESEWDLYSRSALAMQRVVRRGTGSYLIVAHGGVLNSALRAVSGATPSANDQGLFYSFGDTGYARLVYFPERHTWYLVGLNAA